MRPAIIAITLTVVGIAPFVWLFSYIFEGQRDDVATARAFLHHLADAEFAEATELMTPPLLEQVNPSAFALRIGDLEAWDRLRFLNRSSNTDGSGRTTRLNGTGTTISGCESSLTLTIINGRIDMFNITPLCPAADIEA